MLESVWEGRMPFGAPYVVHASEGSCLAGQNRKRSFQETVSRFWERNHPHTFVRMRSVDPDGCTTCHDRVKASLSCDDADLVSLSEKEGILSLALRCGLSEEDVRSAVDAARGRAFEEKDVDDFEKEFNLLVTGRNARSYSRRFSTPKGRPFDLVGRLDGVEGDPPVITECKRRARESLGVTEYDATQCHLYMKLTGIRKCRLVETVTTTGQKVVHDVPFDPDKAKKALIGIASFVDSFAEWVEDPILDDDSVSKKVSSLLTKMSMPR